MRELTARIERKRLVPRDPLSNNALRLTFAHYCAIKSCGASQEGTPKAVRRLSAMCAPMTEFHRSIPLQGAVMPLEGTTILIVESEIAPFVITLQQALEGVGAQSVVAREVSEALERCNQTQFSAALLNEEHKEIENEIAARGLPVMVYSRVSAALAIVAALRLRLEN
jgi:hypothetical protein